MYHDRQLKPARPALSATSSRQYGTTHAFSLEFISCQNNSPARKFKTFFPIYVHIISSHVYVFNGLPRTVVFEVKKFFASSNLLQQIIGIQLIPTFQIAHSCIILSIVLVEYTTSIEKQRNLLYSLNPSLRISRISPFSFLSPLLSPQILIVRSKSRTLGGGKNNRNVNGRVDRRH